MKHLRAGEIENMIKLALIASKEAIRDAISLEDGLDGKDGAAVLSLIDDVERVWPLQTLTPKPTRRKRK